MKTMTLKEGILRTLDGAKVTIMVPADILSMTMEDLANMKELGAYCVYTEELHDAEQEPAFAPAQKEDDKT